MKNEETMKLSLEAYGVKYTVEVDDDITWPRLTIEYMKLLRGIGYNFDRETFINMLEEEVYND